ncbi:MAG: hypothetical protein HKL85_10265 [Acidimicrobiaceae bacterium]|nr:hypothetical protein [Acidimicrobiaceae bacterium]
MNLTSTEVALASVAVAATSGLAAYLAVKRDRRRALYGRAVQEILKWNEMLFRVRRRDPSEDRELIHVFHDLQENLSYYQAWIASESKYLDRSYSRLVKSLKDDCKEPIQAAWAQVRPIPGAPLEDDVNPDPQEHVASFMKDVRSHLSPWFWRRIALAYRNRESRP